MKKILGIGISILALAMGESALACVQELNTSLVGTTLLVDYKTLPTSNPRKPCDVNDLPNNLSMSGPESLRNEQILNQSGTLHSIGITLSHVILAPGLNRIKTESGHSAFGVLSQQTREKFYKQGYYLNGGFQSSEGRTTYLGDFVSLRFRFGRKLSGSLKIDLSEYIIKGNVNQVMLFAESQAEYVGAGKELKRFNIGSVNIPSRVFEAERDFFLPASFLEVPQSEYVTSVSPGHILWGKAITDLKAGTRTATFSVLALGNRARDNEDAVWLDVYNATTNQIVAQRRVNVGELVHSFNFKQLPLFFENSRPGDMIVFRAWHPGRVQMMVDKVTVD